MLESDENNQNREARRQNIGRKIWKSMLDADLNAKYWGYIGKRQFKKNRRLKIALAIVSVSTVAFSDFINSKGSMATHSCYRRGYRIHTADPKLGTKFKRSFNSNKTLYGTSI